MPKLTPTDLEITKAVVAAVPAEAVGRLASSELSQELENHNVGLGTALDTLSELMHFGTNKDNVRLSATKTALQLNRVLDADESAKAEKPVINFIFNDSNVNLQGVFCPQRGGAA